MKPNSALLTALLLMPLAALYAAENRADSAALDVESALTKPGKTFVFAIDQAVTAKPGSWMHRVVETGDYQIGMAWVEVLSGGEVEVTIMAGGKLARSVKARRWRGRSRCHYPARSSRVRSRTSRRS